MWALGPHFPVHAKEEVYSFCESQEDTLEDFWQAILKEWLRSSFDVFKKRKKELWIDYLFLYFLIVNFPVQNLEIRTNP